MFCSMVTVYCHFPRIVFSLVKQGVSGGQEQEHCKALEITVQVSTFVELKLLRNRKVGNKVVVTHYLGYCDDNSTCPRAVPSYSDYYRP